MQEKLQNVTKAAKKASVVNYRRGIRSAVYGLWRGELTRFDFIDSLSLAIESGYRRAWTEGARECGIAFSELTDVELNKLYDMIWEDTNYIYGFADDIEAGSKELGGKLTPLQKRARLWINRYEAVYNQAKLMACRDKKLKWVWSPEKEHCSSCERLNGKVKRQSTWIAAGIVPRNAPNPMLECGGWLCGCNFEVTDEPLSKGRLPSLP